MRTRCTRFRKAFFFACKKWHGKGLFTWCSSVELRQEKEVCIRPFSQATDGPRVFVTVRFRRLVVISPRREEQEAYHPHVEAARRLYVIVSYRVLPRILERPTPVFPISMRETHRRCKPGIKHFSLQCNDPSEPFDWIHYGSN